MAKNLRIFSPLKKANPSTHPGKRFVALFALFMALLFMSAIVLPGVAAKPPAGISVPVSSPFKNATSVEGDGEHYFGYIPTPPGDYPKLAAPKTLKALPSRVDLSADLPPVGNQGRQGSCVAWATGYYYKTWSEKQEHASWDLTNRWYQFSPSFVYNQINRGFDLGAFFPDAFFLMQEKGAVDIDEMPYNDADWTTQPTPAALEAAKPYRIPSDWGYFWIQWWWGPYNPPNPIESVKAWLASGKVLVMGIPVYFDFPGFRGNPPSPYYDYDDTSGFAGWHAVCVTGYDDNINPGGSDPDHRGGFKMVNSWGESWNGPSKGFLYLSYDFVKRYVREAWSMGDIIPDSPTVTSVNPTAAHIGATVSISGNNFGTKRRGARVTFNGVDASDTTFTNQLITAKVPAGTTSGSLVVYDWEGTASNPIQFTVLPTITSISPTSALPGALVTINGANFGSSQGSSYVSFGTVKATDYVSWSETRIDCRVPAVSPGSVLLSVSRSEGSSNAVPFLVGPVPAPTVSSITPSTGVENTTVSITNIAGTGFHLGAEVRLERTGFVIKATDVVVESAEKITCKFNLAGAPLGKYDLVVRNLDGKEGKLAQGFTVTNICGWGAGASLLLFIGVMGLLGLSGVDGYRKRAQRRAR